jgi:hypothetical protein
MFSAARENDFSHSRLSRLSSLQVVKTMSDGQAWEYGVASDDAFSKQYVRTPSEEQISAEQAWLDSAWLIRLWAAFKFSGRGDRHNKREWLASPRALIYSSGPSPILFYFSFRR